MRKSGILLSVTSLPSKYGIGCFSKEAYQFVDWLKEAGQSFWQILPLGPTGFGDSPYQPLSTFAGNPYMIDLEELIFEGLLTKGECNDFNEDIDYYNLFKKRFPLLRKAYERSNCEEDKEYKKFVDENKEWLFDYALFMVIKSKHGNDSWLDWDEDIRIKKDDTVKYYSSQYKDELEFWQFIQYKFYTQWKKLKSYANKKGISIIGDIPIYMALDSSDVWSNQHLFELRKDGTPVRVAGCPPDGFSKTGQLWGNPLYRWDVHKKDNYSWWIKRIKHCFKLYDMVRIDHFRGFDEYYAIDYEAINAISGKWLKGPGIDLFNAIEEKIGKKNIIAEDLGFVTESVKNLLEDTGFPGMKVLEFAFDERDSGDTNDYLPHNYPANSVAYTGTHDNQTLVSWFNTISQKERMSVREYLCDKYTPDKEMYKSLIAHLMMSNSSLVIIPMQDFLGLNDKSRMNTPGTMGENWKWKLCNNELTEELKNEIFSTTKRYGRI